MLVLGTLGPRWQAVRCCDDWFEFGFVCKIFTLFVQAVDLVPFQFLPRCMKCRRGLAMRILSVRLSVCLSVRLSVRRVICDKMEGRSVQIFIPYERTLA